MWDVIFIRPGHKIGTWVLMCSIDNLCLWMTQYIILFTLTSKLQPSKWIRLCNGPFISNVIHFFNSLKITILCLNSSYALKNQIMKWHLSKILHSTSYVHIFWVCWNKNAFGLVKCLSMYVFKECIGGRSLWTTPCHWRTEIIFLWKNGVY